MKLLHLDCGMGAAGDMLAGALLELLPQKEAFLEKINSLGLPGVTVSAEPSVKCGITGTHYAVSVYDTQEDDTLHTHTHSHNTLHDIQHLIWQLDVPVRVKTDALAVYDTIAQAEAAVHGVTELHHIHFHEVGTLDAVADVVSVCYLLYLLKPEKILASPICVGSGTVRCAHGILPVPAPATARILEGLPIYAGRIESELCTPTGAALLKHFVSEFVPMPPMTLEACGYGMGRKDFPRANCLRAMLGTTQGQGEEILELKCNLDDMTGEAIGFALETLMAQGAMDAFTTPIGMKKSRPGQLLTVLCRPEQRDAMVTALLHHTTTLGVRESLCRRHTLTRISREIPTPWGPVGKKESRGYGVQRSKYEYEDLARIAREQGICLDEARELVRQRDEP